VFRVVRWRWWSGLRGGDANWCSMGRSAEGRWSIGAQRPQGSRRGKPVFYTSLEVLQVLCVDMSLVPLFVARGDADRRSMGWPAEGRCPPRRRELTRTIGDRCPATARVETG
jgi:hypothetical protein